MRRFTVKRNNDAAVSEFIRSGGKVTTVKAKVKPEAKNRVEVVEIEVDLLPPQLRRFVC